jgi:protein TonB
MKKIIALLILLSSTASFSQRIDKQKDDLIYNLEGIDVKPEFPEGLDKLNSYITENELKLGLEKETKTSAKSYAMFVVEKDGTLSAIKMVGKAKEDVRKTEALTQLLQSLPRWNPGKQNGKVVRVLYVLPLGV